MAATQPLLSDKDYRALERRMRIMLDDFSESNELLGEEVYSRDRIEIAVEDALDDWNSTPPPLAPVTFEDHPAPSLLYRRVQIELLRHEHLKLTRNGVEFNDGGAAISDGSKANAILQLINTINVEYQQAKTSRKTSINLRGAWGGIPSEYSGGYYGL